MIHRLALAHLDRAAMTSGGSPTALTAWESMSSLGSHRNPEPGFAAHTVVRFLKKLPDVCEKLPLTFRNQIQWLPRQRQGRWC